MTIVPQTLHKFNSGDTFVGANIANGNLVIGETRNEEHATEGKFPQLLAVIPLAEAIAIAKAVLASQAQEQADEDAAYEAYIEEQWRRHEDRFALMDDALESDIRF
jgi:6,7-dimethyl-8-ribityllumazine synthase